jgi:hypothetical protein
MFHGKQKIERTGFDFMFMTKKERRQMWRARIFHAMQAAALCTVLVAGFYLLLWLDVNGLIGMAIR